MFCDDAGYDGLSSKMVRMTKWALNHGYTHIFRVDTDAYVYVHRLFKSGFEKHDYTGYCIDYPKWNEQHRYACGAGFCLSERAMTIVVNNVPDHTADDLWVGRILYRHGIKCVRDTRYLTGFDGHYVDLQALPKQHPYIVLHALTPDGIRELHARGNAGADITPPLKPLNEPDYEAQWATYGWRK